MMRIKCGSASYTDVIALVGLKLFLSTPRGTDTYNFAGVTFKAEVTTVVLNGMTGAPRWPPAPYPTKTNPKIADERYTTAEQSVTSWRTSRWSSGNAGR